MPLSEHSPIELTAFRWVPPPAQRLVKDLRVRWALEEAQLYYRVRLIGMDRPDGYLQDQPFDQVPCFRDDSVQIFESGAIVQYIGEKDTRLLPAAKSSRYRAIQWTYAAVNSIEPFVQLRALLDGVFAGEKWARLSRPTFDHYAYLRLEQLSHRLGERDWLEHDGFTIGDLMMISVLRIAARCALLDDFPNLAGYVRRGEDRAAFKTALGDQLDAFVANQPADVGAAT